MKSRNRIIAWMIAGTLTASVMAVPVVGQSKAPSVQPSATDKVVINGWALNMSNIATGTNQTIRIMINS